MKKFLISVLAVAAMVGCKKHVIEAPKDETDFGYVTLDITSDTEMQVVTKGEPSAEELATYNVTLTDESGPVTKEFAEISAEGWKVPAGTYSVYVENLNADEAAPADSKGFMRLANSVDGVTVSKGATSNVSMMLLPVNSRVTVAYDETFGEVFQNPQVTISGGSRQFLMDWGHEAANGAYYEGATDLTWSLTANLSGSDETKTYTSTSAIQTVAGKWSQINFSTNATDGIINVSITIADDFSEEDVVNVPVTIDPFSAN